MGFISTGISLFFLCRNFRWLLTKSIEYSNVYSLNKTGFYNYKIKNNESITAFFNKRSIRMFLFCEYFNSSNIILSIDDKIVSLLDNGSSNIENGLAIDADEKVNITFNTDKEINVNVWLIPSFLCPDLSIYAFDKYLIDIAFPLTTSKICIFSPIIDSLETEINYGIISQNIHITSSVYTRSFYIPEIKEMSNKSVKAKLKEPYIIQINCDDMLPAKPEDFYNNIIYYKRELNAARSREAQVGIVSNCNSTNGCSSQTNPQIEVSTKNLGWLGDLLWIAACFLLSYYKDNIDNFLMPIFRRKKNFLMFGLKNAGKKTLASKIVQIFDGSAVYDDKMENIKEAKIITLNFDIKIYEFGEGPCPSYNWLNKLTGIIFVIDASDFDNITEAREALNMILLNKKYKGLDLLIFLNKMDCKNTISIDLTWKILDLKSIKDRKWSIEGVSARNGPGISDGISWLLRNHKE